MPMGKYGREAFEACPECRHFYLISGNEFVPGTEGASTLDDLTRGIGDGIETYPTSAEDTAVIVYTSGTTGFAKGAELSHCNLFTNAMLSVDILRSCEDDVQLVVLPLFHIFGMTVMMNAGIYKGLHSILLPKFDAEESFRLIERHRISIFAGVPTMYWSMLDHSADRFDHSSFAGRLRVCISGGASLPLELLKAFEERFRVPILEGYGMSEGAPVVTFNYMQTGRKPGSVGVPVWGVEVKLVDKSGAEVPPGEEGELLFRGPNVMKGYYKRAADTDIVLKDGWLHSGDLAVKDVDGFYYIVDRIKDMIIRGGMKVYPREVEEVLMQHPSVSIAAVIGTTHEKWGEEVKAFIVLKTGHSVAAESIIAWAKERMAAYKYPRLIEFIDKLPVSASGKILKRVLRLPSQS
jgi:long-chain acyl-CoA synthetase